MAKQKINNIPDFKHTPPVDLAGVMDRVNRFSKRSIKKEAKVSGLKMALNMIDLTTLEGADTKGKITQLCYKAMHLNDDYPNLPTVAAVCIYPIYVGTAKKLLGKSGVKVASVATAFPSGHASLQVKLDDVKCAVDQGADEVDMVISRGRFHQGDYNFVFDEIATIKENCGSAHLKVILETGELGTLDRIRKASDIALAAGADFIKTSTGKISPAATMPVVFTMLNAVGDYYYKTGERRGVKPAGGIRTAKQALQYLVMIKETVGEEWLTNKLFRFGASSLANDLLLQLNKQLFGNYQSSDYISID